MVPVALPTYNRPEYLKKTLKYLEENELKDEIVLVTSEEPNKECQKIISDTILPKRRIINSRRKGICANVCQAITAAAMMKEWFVCVEDDVLIGWDSIAMAKEILEDIVNFENTDSTKENDLYAYREDNWFHCHGWAARSEIWFEFIKRFDPERNPHWSWANPFNYFLKKEKIVTPEISRSSYIGVKGEFSTPEKYKRHLCDYVQLKAFRKKRKYFQLSHRRHSRPSRDYIEKECEKRYRLGLR